MRMTINQKIAAGFIFVSAFFVIGSAVYSHCQIPCGIYNDPMRFDEITENITTIEKSMNMINQLSAESKPNMNQLVRWIENKDTHADELSEIITYYFMAQRVAPVEKTNAAAYDKYINKLALMHQIVVASMKSKQSTDLSIVKQLTELTAAFKKAYSEPAEQK